MTDAAFVLPVPCLQRVAALESAMETMAGTEQEDEDGWVSAASAAGTGSVEAAIMTMDDEPEPEPDPAAGPAAAGQLFDASNVVTLEELSQQAQTVRNGRRRSRESLYQNRRVAFDQPCRLPLRHRALLLRAQSPMPRVAKRTPTILTFQTWKTLRTHRSCWTTRCSPQNQNQD